MRLPRPTHANYKQSHFRQDAHVDSISEVQTVLPNIIKNYEIEAQQMLDEDHHPAHTHHQENNLINSKIANDDHDPIHLDIEPSNTYTVSYPKLPISEPEHSCRTNHEQMSLGVEETLVYFLLALLLVFLFIQMARCIRTTLDPYHTFARAAWFETLTKVRTDAFV